MTFNMLMRATELITEDMTAGLRADGLTVARAAVLWQLAASEPRTQRELADALNVTPRNVTALVDALEEAGFVARDPHPDDRRAILVSLTEKGGATVARLDESADALADRLFDGLPADELAVVTRVLADVAEVFRT
ncbi:MarR family winged helix-turn-helix transcriptional regulator [Allokutzneria sp. NRRL B-24872]|uniref:MarR family winged helix-turn-helix transcriptional regulator n=1 Tax=Allokutzneria sp. NRRL B-24872 TaxID=1137961 RepID=UPI001AEF79EA|nr:MarR family transcriptional regulator [Allokutzneria sp. NRRL B-24872]